MSGIFPQILPFLHISMDVSGKIAVGMRALVDSLLSAVHIWPGWMKALPPGQVWTGLRKALSAGQSGCN